MSVQSFHEQVALDTANFGGYLRCETCGVTGFVFTAYWRVGWPKCCGYTMRWWTQRQIDAGEVPALDTEASR